MKVKTYNLIFQKTINGKVAEGSLDLGAVEHSYEIATGDVVTVEEKVFLKIAQKFPEVKSNQLWVGQVIHHLGVGSATVFLVNDKKSIGG